MTKKSLPKKYLRYFLRHSCLQHWFFVSDDITPFLGAKHRNGAKINAIYTVAAISIVAALENGAIFRDRARLEWRGG